MAKDRKTLVDRVSELGRMTAAGLGLIDDEPRTWIALREAIERGDDPEIDRLQGKLGLGRKHVEFARLAIRLDGECREAAAAWEKAQARLRAIDSELQALRAMVPGTISEATEIGKRFQELDAERVSCLNKQTHEAVTGVREFAPELWGLPSGPKPSGCTARLYNAAREWFDVCLYRQSWLDVPRLSEPRKRVKVVAG